MPNNEGPDNQDSKFKSILAWNDREDKSLLKAVSIYEFLSSNKLKRIPKYQRPYSWEKNNITKLISDILKASENERDWFLGSIFTTQQSDGELAEVEILDGQQRITTIIL